MIPRYVVLTPFFPTEENFYGPFIYDQVKALQKIGSYEIVVIKLVGSGEDHVYDYQGITVHQVKVLDLPSFILPGIFNGLNFKKILNRLDNLLGGKLNTIKYIHGHVSYPCGVLTSLLAKRIGAVSIIQHHGFDVMGYSNGRIGWFGLEEEEEL